MPFYCCRFSRLKVVKRDSMIPPQIQTSLFELERTKCWFISQQITPSSILDSESLTLKLLVTYPSTHRCETQYQDTINAHEELFFVVVAAIDASIPGELTSLNYPNGYANRLYIEWLISCDAGNRVQVTILNLDLEESFDFLTVRPVFSRISFNTKYMVNTHVW